MNRRRVAAFVAPLVAPATLVLVVAGPSAAMPDGLWDGARALGRIAAGRDQARR